MPGWTSERRPGGAGIARAAAGVAIVSAMTGNPAVEAQDWAEANISAGVARSLPEVLLLDVVDSLIHEVLKERIESWHYFWEHDPINTVHLRLRLLWRPGAGREGSAVLARCLDEAEASGRLSSWYLGNHGVRGERYEGEAAAYDGPEMWRVTYEDWQAGQRSGVGPVDARSSGAASRGAQVAMWSAGSICTPTAWA